MNFCLVASVAAAFVILGSGKLQPSLQPATAQSVLFQDTAKQLYQRLPDFPLENRYVSKTTGKIAADNTLARRLIQYHSYIKGRSPLSRLDWKLTLADYLGANETLIDSTYPGHNLLRSNPMKGDVTAINRLNRSQRDVLVQALVDVFTGKANQAVESPSTSRSSTSSGNQPNAEPAPQLSPIPKPGDARLLSP